jgi:hypothetical protein
VSESITERDRRLLIRLADGTLSGRLRAEAQARVAQIPDAPRLIARQRRVARALGGTAAPVPAPAAARFGMRLRVASALAAALVGVVVLLGLNGRETRTVFYEHMGHRVAYTIVSGAPVPVPAGARLVHRNGQAIAVYQDGDRDIAVFRRGGRTCVLAGHVLHQSTLVALAAWDPRG